MTPPFWSGRRVFLTGHTGFKGGWLARWLHHLGSEVTGFALPPSTATAFFGVTSVGAICHSRFGDVRHGSDVLHAMAEARPEVVFHLAAQPLVLASYAEPVETFDVNVMGTVNVLDAVRNCSSVRAVVIVTTDKCYANREAIVGYREEDRLGGDDPYSCSKACAELVTDAYRKSYFAPAAYDRHGVAVATARAGNVVGGGDWSPSRLVPDLLQAFHRGEPAVLRRPEAVRPWQHVLEPLAGYMLLAERLLTDGPRWASAWNFGPRDSEMASVGEVAARLAALWGSGARCEVRHDPEQRHETTRLRLDSSRAERELGWRPRWSLDETLALTVAWEQARLAGADMVSATLEQLERYSLDI